MKIYINRGFVFTALSFKAAESTLTPNAITYMSARKIKINFYIPFCNICFKISRKRLNK